MLHLHLKACPSTQLYLKENYNDLFLQDRSILVSTDNQLNGVGRYGNIWDDYQNALAFSFLLKPIPNAITIPLIIGIVLCHYIKKEWNIDLSLKWPNDLINNQGQKCGGIICQYVNEESVICGIGLNLGYAQKIFFNKNYKTQAGVINSNLKLQNHDRQSIPKNIYDYFFSYDISRIDVKKCFEQLCFHLNKRVSITDNDKEWVGIFQGISDNGEAVLQESDGHFRNFISGSLNILTN